MRQFLATALMAAVTFGPLVTPEAANAANPPAKARPPYGQAATPIQHLVIIFEENVSFDHYSEPIPMRPILRESRSSKLLLEHRVSMA